MQKRNIIDKLKEFLFGVIFREWPDEGVEKDRDECSLRDVHATKRDAGQINGPVQKNPLKSTIHVNAKRTGQNYYIVDGENVGMRILGKIAEPSKKNKVLYFYSKYCVSNIDKLKKECELKNSGCHIKYIRVERTNDEKQVLDKALIERTQKLINREGKDNTYIIVSKDKDYDETINQWQSLGFDVERKTPVDLIDTPWIHKTYRKKAKRKKKKSAVKLADVRQLLDDDAMPDKVVNIINGYKKRTDINKGLTKLYRDSKRAGSVYKKIKPLLKAQNKI